MKNPRKAISSFHVGVAAEAIAAAQFARCGFDVSIQYGANQPEYDLMVVAGKAMMKVSVKGSQDGGWGLTQSFVENADYYAATATWLARHKPGTVFCFVQFKGTKLAELPRLYLATPSEVATVLNACSNGAGSTILYEDHQWTSRAKAAGSRERIPDAWRFSPERIAQLLTEV